MAILASARAALPFNLRTKDELAPPSRPPDAAAFSSAHRTPRCHLSKKLKEYICILKYGIFMHWCVAFCKTATASQRPPAINEKISYEMRIHKARNIRRDVWEFAVCVVYTPRCSQFMQTFTLHTTHGRYFDT